MRILVLDGHPDPDRARFVHALADAYAESATAAGHQAGRLDVATLGIAPLRSVAEWEGEAAEPIRAAQEAIAGAEHIVMLYPLWLGDIPAALKALLEQVLRPGFAFPAGVERLNAGLLKGRSVRVVGTMGMPAPVYRWFFGAHSLRSLDRNILRFVGMGPVRWTLIGGVGGMTEAAQGWTAKLRALGAAGS